MENIASGGHGNDIVTIGHKHGLPTLPIPSMNNLKHRYDPLVMQVTNLLMRDGKKKIVESAGIIKRILAGVKPGEGTASEFWKGSQNS